MMIALHQITPGLVVRDRITGRTVEVMAYWTNPTVLLQDEAGERLTVGIDGLIWANMEPVNVTMTITQEKQDG